MKKGFFLGGVALALGLGVFGLLRSRGGQSGPSVEKLKSAVAKSRQWHAGVESEVLKARNALTLNYDRVLYAGHQVDLALADLKKNADALPKLKADIDSYEKAWTEKRQAIEDFKSTNAILRNSLAYLPTLTGKIVQVGSPQAANAEKALRQILAYNSTGNKGLIEDIQPKLDEIVKASQGTSKADEMTRLFPIHAQTVISRREAMDQQLGSILSGEKADALGSLEKGLNKELKAIGDGQGLRTAFLTLLCALLIGGVLAAFLRLTRAQKSIRLANLDLEARTEELEQAQVNMEAAYSDLSKVLGQVRDTSLDLTSSSESLMQISSDSRRGAETTADAMRQTSQSVEDVEQAIKGLAVSAANEYRIVTAATGDLRQLQDRVDELSVAATTLNEAMIQACTAATDGEELVKTSKTRIDCLQEHVSYTGEAISNLGAKNKEICAIVETITQIASQTNLLSLNASIEAARAGEHGRGFMVVAEEVRKLAEITSASAKEIGDLITSIQGYVTEAVNSIERTKAEATHTVEANEHTSLAFGQVLNSTKVAAEKAQSMAEESTSIQAGVQQVNGAMSELLEGVKASEENVSSISSSAREMADRATQTLLWTNEQQSQVEELAKFSDVLQGKAGHLQELLEDSTIAKAA